MVVVHASGPDGRVFSIDDGLLEPHRALAAARRGSEGAFPSRLAFAAAHVVMKPTYRQVPHTPDHPGTPEQIAEHMDWKATMALRRHLDDQGLGIAEAMDTAQRFSLGWVGASRLIQGCGALGLRNGFVAGAGVDHLESVGGTTELVDGVVHQAGSIHDAGGTVMILPMPWLTESRSTASTYVQVYGDIIRQLPGPLFVHWLGDMFLPALKGYFPEDSFQQIMKLDPGKVRGCKLSLLDADLEVRIRRELLERDQIVLTGDDLHFTRLVLGQGAAGGGRHTTIANRRVPLGDFSHALLGILDAIAVPAGLALKLLARGDTARYLEIMEPCERLSRHVFSEPTSHYKTGLAFLAWLNGLQNEFMLVNHEERCRDTEHLLRTAELAAAAGALHNAPLAAERLRSLSPGPGR